jgi:protein SCO1/2
MVRRFWITGIAAAVALCASAAIAIYHENGLREDPTIEIGGAFTMTDQDGRAITKLDLDQTAVALFAGFTHCPDICPTTLLRLSSLRKQLGSEADKIRVILVTVDPERDTPELLKSYLSSFEDDFTGMTGTAKQLKSFAKVYRLFYEKSGTGSDYTMNHTAGVFLFRKGGTFHGTIDQHEPDNVALSKLKMLAGS